MEMYKNIICSALLFCMVIKMWLVDARTCGSGGFDDVGSKAVLADLVLDGWVKRTLDPKENGRYNAVFSLKKILKGKLPRGNSRNKYGKIIIGEFGPSDPKQCIGPVARQRYLVFLEQSLPGNSSFYKISALPSIFSKRDRKIIRNTICNECVNAPTVSLRKRMVIDIAERKAFSLKCEISGNPKPTVTWFKDGQEIKRGSGYTIKNSKKFSRLKLNTFKESHAGVYTCKASNLVGNGSASTHVSLKLPDRNGPAKARGPQNITLQTTTEQGNFTNITTTVSTPRHFHYVDCDKKWTGYCKHGGQCLYAKDLGEKFCRCATDYNGPRCQYLDLMQLMKEMRKRQEIEFDRKVTMAGIIIGGVVLITLFLAAYCMARKRRKEFLTRRQHRESRRQAMQNGATYTKVSTLDGPVPVVETHHQIPLGAQFSRESRDHGTQTEEYDPFKALRETIIDGPGENPCLDEGPGPDRPVVSLPPPPADNQRQRLSAVSATPIVDPDRIVYPHNNNTTTINAIVEAQPEPPVNASQHSSPSQSSKTESAHGQSDPTEIPIQIPRAGGSDSASHDIDSLEVEAHSDYDNNVSDLEDEGQDLAFSGDELRRHNAHQGNGDVHEASSGMSDSDSSDGLDHDHFKELQNKRLLNMKNKSMSVPPPNRHTKPVPWEGYGNSVPTHPTDPYYNSYAGCNNDRITPVRGKNIGPTVPSDTHRLINTSPRRGGPQV